MKDTRVWLTKCFSWMSTCFKNKKKRKEKMNHQSIIILCLTCFPCKPRLEQLSWMISQHFCLQHLCLLYAKSFFPCTARLWKTLPIECFPFTCHLNSFKSRINRHLFNCRIFLKMFPVCFKLFVLNGCSALHVVNPNLKNTSFLCLFSDI